MKEELAKLKVEFQRVKREFDTLDARLSHLEAIARGEREVKPDWQAANKPSVWRE